MGNGVSNRAVVDHPENTTGLMYLHAGIQTISGPASLEDWRVGPTDGRLTRRAVGQVMNDRAATLRSVLPLRNSHNQDSRNQGASRR